MDSYGFKLPFGGGEISRDCMGPVLSGFHYSNKKYDIVGQTSQPILVRFMLSTEFFHKPCLRTSKFDIFVLGCYAA